MNQQNEKKGNNKGERKRESQEDSNPSLSTLSKKRPRTISRKEKKKGLLNFPG